MMSSFLANCVPFLVSENKVYDWNIADAGSSLLRPVPLCLLLQVPPTFARHPMSFLLARLYVAFIVEGLEFLPLVALDYVERVVDQLLP